MHVELVRTKTSDGFRLDGAWQAPAPSVESIAEVDTVICLHGVGGNFYGSTMMEQLASSLTALGLAVLRVNTRGHDGVSTAATDQGGRLQGAAYEIVDECRYDVQAWADFVQSRGSQRVALLGHSLGAIKALYAQAMLPQSAIVRLLAISPPRLAYSQFVQGADAGSFKRSLANAEGLIAAGEPQTLFQATFPFPLVLSAATFLDKYGAAERYNFLKFAKTLQTPIDFIYGQRELDAEGSAFRGIDTDVQNVAWTSPCSVSVIPGANHFYAGCVAQLIEVVRRKLV